ncbi:MAG TPA: hypothetical protein VGN63_06515 [Flavisolibacter sp.]|jgi:hypothetical protein|nr:hypothetical protein [Flavisolibacter sp.]
MTMKVYLLLAACTALLSSCLKHSIEDAMLNGSGSQSTTATLRYEINGNPVTLSVKNAGNQAVGSRTLYCEKAVGYVLSGVSSAGEFVFTFYTDSLMVGNYSYTSNLGPLFVTTFEGKPQYVYGPSDHMNFSVTSHKDGRISGKFSGQLTPAIVPGYPNNVYGTPGSVLIRNGSFDNVPVFY